MRIDDTKLSISTAPMTTRTLPPPSRRRDKVQLSCTFCKGRKLRCDRNRPCSTCASRGIGIACTYAGDKRGGTTVEEARTPDAPPKFTIKERLDRMEHMVTSLMDACQNESRQVTLCKDLAGATGPAPQPQVPTEPGNIHISSTGPIYVGGGHWTAMLGEISDLRQHLAQQDSEADPIGCDDSPASGGSRRPPQGPLLLRYGCHNSLCFTRESILAALPDRRVVDRLVSLYFNGLNVPFAIIHPPSFLHQAFWHSPDEPPIFWIGLLFSIICLSALRQRILETEGDCADADPELDPDARPRPAFLEQVVQCLLLGGYQNGGMYLIETLLNYFMIEHSSCLDSYTGNWLLFGVMLRLALRMGYHRDPSLFPAIGVFHGEMRRRVWSVLYSADIALSLQMGMPRMIKDGQWDTQRPRHLVDADLSEAMTKLPPSRPATEVTMTLFFLSRHDMALIMGKIVDWTVSTGGTENPGLDPKIIEKRLRDAYGSIDSRLKYTTLTECLGEPAHHVMCRLGTTTMYLQCLVYLTWRDLLPGPTLLASSRVTQIEISHHSDTAASRQACIDSALQLLEFQDLIYTEGQPGGIVHAARYIFTSTLAHPFLMATAVLIAYMSRTATESSSTRDEEYAANVARIETALKRSHQIWIRESAQGSLDAKKATDMLDQLFEGPYSPQQNGVSHWQDLLCFPQDQQMDNADTFPFTGTSN